MKKKEYYQAWDIFKNLLEQKKVYGIEKKEFEQIKQQLLNQLHNMEVSCDIILCTNENLPKDEFIRLQIKKEKIISLSGKLKEHCEDITDYDYIDTYITLKSPIPKLIFGVLSGCLFIFLLFLSQIS